MPSEGRRGVCARPSLTGALLTAAVLSLSGCAATSGTGAADTLQTLFPEGGGAGSLRGEAEVTVSFAGASVAFPAAVILQAPSSFRIDLLDPFDRPAAVIFSRGNDLVQYRPAAAEAALLRPLPDGCRSVTPDGWVPFVLGEGPPPAGVDSYMTVKWLRGDSLVKYEWGTLAVKIDYRPDGERSSPSRVSWYCGEELAMRLEFGEMRPVGRGRIPGTFTVAYPGAGMKVSVALGAVEAGVKLDAAVLDPHLPRRTRWVEWDLVRGE
jgi:hypothetical protein